MRLLLTGGTGFIGRAVIRRAFAAGNGLGLLLRSAGKAPVGLAKHYTLGQGPWKIEDIAEAISDFKPDALIHLAGLAKPVTLEEAYEANVFQGERIMAAASAAAPDVPVLIVGSAAEYGAPSRVDGVSCPTDPCWPRTLYGISKLAQTMHALLRARGGQHVTVARLFNPVGPSMPLGLVFSDVAAQLATGVDVLRTGDIDTRRDFMDVDEAARILLDLAAAPSRGETIVNVCSGVAQPIRDSIERMIERIDRPVRLVQDVSLFRPSDVKSIAGDTASLRALGVRPASPDITRALMALLDEAGVPARSTAQRQDH